MVKTIIFGKHGLIGGLIKSHSKYVRILGLNYCVFSFQTHLVSENGTFETLMSNTHYGFLLHIFAEILLCKVRSS